MQSSTTRPHYFSAQIQLEQAEITRKPWIVDACKRAFDVGVSLLALIILAPVFILVGISIKRDSPGPVFFRGARLGRGGRKFSIFKFRTMFERQECYSGPRVTAQDDPRVTPLGRWLRDTKLNELPQLWNVLVGDMSLVGPRPEDPHLASAWQAETRAEVLSVRPGVTSPASVLYRDEETLLESSGLMDRYLKGIVPSKLRLDQLYVRHRSFWLDLDVLFWTFLVLLPKVGASVVPEERLFIGPVTRLMRRYVSWFMVDTLVTFGAIGTAGVFWRSFGPLDVGLGKSVAIAVGFALLYSIVGAMVGVNRVVWSQAAISDAVDLLPAIGLGTVAAIVLNYAWADQAILPYGLIVLSAVLASIGFVTVRYRSRLIQALLTRWIAWRGTTVTAQERVLIVGGGESGQFMAWWLQNGRASNLFRVVGFVDDDLLKQGTRIRGINVLGRRDDITELVAKYDVGMIVFAIHNIPDADRYRLLDICHATPAAVMTVPDIPGNLFHYINQNGKNGGEERDLPGSAEVTIPREAVTISPEHVNAWLNELDDKASNGDLQGVQSMVRTIRDRLASVSESS